MKFTRLIFAATLAAILPAQAFAQETDDAYARDCAACHGPELRGGETGPTLIGAAFQQKWNGLGQAELGTFIRRTMPPGNPASLSDRDYAAALGRIRRANSWPVTPPPDSSAAVLPLKPVGPAEWLNNRGDAGSTSYSPLDQIDRDNVGKLRVAWRWKSDNFGPTPELYFRATPLMANGVLYRVAMDVPHDSPGRRGRC